ncbi:hypothetical protein WMF43_04890 [Sorangium sp. So ce131]
MDPSGAPASAGTSARCCCPSVYPGGAPRPRINGRYTSSTISTSTLSATFGAPRVMNSLRSSTTATVATRGCRASGLTSPRATARPRIDRYAQIADRFPELIRAFVARGKAQGKPVAITEFGCATYRGAADAGPRGGEIVVWDQATATPLGLNGEYVRDEAEQATTLRELLEIFDAEGVDAAFVHVFASYALPHDPDDPRRDLDLASTGVVKVLADGTWEPKEAFSVLADYFSRGRPTKQAS